MKKYFAVLLGLVCSVGMFASPATAQEHTFSLGDSVFLLDHKPFQIISGEMHYVRIPEAYWKDRLHKARAMGLNTVAVYCMWNMHEPEPGRWDFRGNEDVAKFVRLAQEEGLWVILRPGPYVCAEWEFGGYPWWLLKEKDMKVRSRDPRFMAASKKYLLQLGKQLASLQISRGGPILMVQVENEYGSFGRDTAYERQIAHNLLDAGFNVPFFTADGDWLFKHAALPGILPGANGESDPEKLKKLVNEFHGGKGPYFVPELYPGWLDHWGHKFQRVPASRVVKETKGLLDAGVSVNFYMWHGGTNFAFMNGANFDDKEPIQPDITSYDYDAPLSEAGVPTEKYRALRELIMQYLPEQERLRIPPVPAAPEFIRIPDIKLTKAAALFDNLPEPVHNPDPLNMEALNQGYGYTLYRTTIGRAVAGQLKVNGLRDYAEVFVNGKRIGILNRMKSLDSLKADLPANSRLDILVENLGRINYGHEMVNNLKGITGSVMLNGEALKGWDMYCLPFKSTTGIRFVANRGEMNGPVIYEGSFSPDKIGDTFLDMSEWGKGIVFINGHNLGKYWSIGPQQTLYLPGCWLKKGTNTLVIFDQLGGKKTSVSATDHPVLDRLQ